jgi:hypothetical protein
LHFVDDTSRRRAKKVGQRINREWLGGRWLPPQWLRGLGRRRSIVSVRFVLVLASREILVLGFLLTMRRVVEVTIESHCPLPALEEKANSLNVAMAHNNVS